MPDRSSSLGMEAELEPQVVRLVDSLAARNDVCVAREVLDRLVRTCLAEWQDAPIKDFVAILVERSVRQRLSTHVEAPATLPASASAAASA